MNENFNPINDNAELVLTGEHNVGKGNTGKRCDRVGRFTLVESSILTNGTGKVQKCENPECKNDDIPVARIV